MSSEIYFTVVIAVFVLLAVKTSVLFPRTAAVNLVHIVRSADT
jgi:hypothetical protein